jgi:TRAP-type transport system periplasmic protein
MKTSLKVLTLGWLLMMTPLSAQELKIATLAPDGSSWMNEFRQAADRILDGTDQRVRVRFYPGGVMGDANAVLRRMRLGQLHGGAFTLGDLSPVANVVNLYSLPFVFKDEDEILAVRDQFDPLIIAALDEAGVVVPRISMGGFAYLFGRQAFPGPDGLDTSWRVWVPPNDPLSRRTLELAGVSPVPLTLAEVYTGLQTGTVNTFASTPAAAIILQWHSRARHMLDLPILMTGGTVGLDKRVFNRLSGADQAVVMEAFSAALAALEQTSRNENNEAREALQRQGINLGRPTPEQTQAWRAIAEQTRREMLANGQIRVPHLSELEQALERVREAP